MYNMDSNAVASVLSNPLVEAFINLILFVVIITVSYYVVQGIEYIIKAIRDFIKGYRDNIGDNMALDIEIETERKLNKDL